MKSLVSAAVAVLALTAPFAAFAQQSDHAVTRAEVKAELVRLEAAGYRPATDRNQYPANIQAAESRLNPIESAQNSASATPNVAAASYGGAVATTGASGQRTMLQERNSLYRGH
ncbi:MAG: DUF4148 domain-containing protein [Paraburkholderia sp.]|jgi:hypothetical protein|nr:DUF4148 domain-containing protein [Paraburkholderia sp.]